MTDSGRSGTRSLDGHQAAVPLRRSIVALVATLLAEVVVLLAYLLPVKLGVLPRPGDAQIAALLWVATAVAIAVVGHVLLRRGGLSLRQLGFVRPTWRLLHLLWQAPLSVLVSAAVGAGILRLTTGSSVRSGHDGDLSEFGSAGPAVVVAVVVLAVIVTPLWEEALFRGAVFLGFRGHGGAVSAVVGSAALFALFHVLPVAWPFLLPLGLCLGLVRWFHRNLWASVGLHALNNTLAVSVLLAALG